MVQVVANGFKVDLQVSDWATMIQRNKKPELWEVFITHSPFLPEPALIGALSTSAPGNWDTPARKVAVDAFNAETDPKKRIALWADVQKVIYAEAPIIKIGDFNALSAKSPKLEHFTPAPWPYFWNVSLKQ